MPAEFSLEHVTGLRAEFSFASSHQRDQATGFARRRVLLGTQQAAVIGVLDLRTWLEERNIRITAKIQCRLPIWKSKKNRGPRW